MAWWSVDLATGEILGVLDSGLHGAQPMTEHGTLIMADAEVAGEVAAPGYVITPPVDAYAATMPNGFAGVGAATGWAGFDALDAFVYAGSIF
jgi:hypothetical protein